MNFKIRRKKTFNLGGLWEYIAPFTKNSVSEILNRVNFRKFNRILSSPN